MTYSLYISDSYDPYYNLAYENQLLLNIRPNHVIVFLYVNRPCMVFGRFQNPWAELNLPLCLNDNIELVRRQSGGGTVYHDKYNLNFSFIHANNDYKKEHNIEIIKEVLGLFDIKLSLSERTDLFVQFEGSDKKISGSAFKQKKDRSFHHGTLLINSDLSSLKQYLQSPFDISDSKAIASNPNTVVNLSQLNNKLTVDKVIDGFKSTLKSRETSLKIYENTKLEDNSYYEHLMSDEWIFTETPLFTLYKKHNDVELEITLKKTIIKDLKINCSLDLSDFSKSVLEKDLKFCWNYFSDKALEVNDPVFNDVCFIIKSILYF